MSRIVLYQKQVERQKKTLSLSVKINKEKKYGVEYIDSKRCEKIKYLVR